MKFFSIDEIRSNRVSRAITDLRRSVPITINKKYLISAVETLSEAHFSKLRQSFKDKLTIVTQWSLQDASGFDFKKIRSFCEHSSEKPVIRSNFEFDSKLLKRIAMFTKLLPIFLVVKLSIDDEAFLNEACILNLDEADLIAYEANINSNLEQIVTNIPVPLKDSHEASVTIFRVTATGEEHYAITIGKLGATDPLVRLHSSCYTGDLLQSLRCDCSSQLLAAIQILSAKPENAGIIVYLAQEGRGIGLVNKLRAYGLQDKGYDTVEANEQLGFDIDGRDYSIAAEMLNKLGVNRIRLLTNNPQKIGALTEKGIEISKVLPLTTESNVYNKGYIETKRNKMAHTI
jgi:GTP cyclohydrolase II